MVNISPTFSIRNGSLAELLNCNANGWEADSLDIILEVNHQDAASEHIFDAYCQSVIGDEEFSAKLLSLMLFMRMKQLSKGKCIVRLNTLVKGGFIRRRLTGSLEMSEVLRALDFQPATRLQVSWLLEDLVDTTIKMPSAITVEGLLRRTKEIKENRLASPFITPN